jgi:cytochrome oxidase assembly protein ShyY1
VGRYAFLRRPKWLGLLAAVLIIVPAFFALSRWQLNRLDERRHYNDLVTQQGSSAPVPLDTLLNAGASTATVTDTLRWRQVSVTGQYDPSHQLLVRKRPLDGTDGFWVATPLITPSGSVVVVNRGWIKVSGSATSTPEVPDPPSGQVSVIGRIQPSQLTDGPEPADMPTGQVSEMDVRLIGGQLGSVYPGYIELISSTPAQSAGLALLPLPDLTDGPHLAYAIQWVLFAGVTVAGYVMLARREREYEADLAQERAARKATDKAPSGGPAPNG